MAQTVHGTDWAGCSMPSSFPSDADSIPFEPPQYPDIILPRTTQLIRISKNQTNEIKESFVTGNGNTARKGALVSRFSAPLPAGEARVIYGEPRGGGDFALGSDHGQTFFNAVLTMTS